MRGLGSSGVPESGWRASLRRPSVVATAVFVLVGAFAVVTWAAAPESVQPRRLVAAADGTIAQQRLAFFSEHHAAIAERDYGAASPATKSMFNAVPDDQPSGRGGKLAFISYGGDGESAGEVYYWDGARHRVTTDGAVHAEPDISPDGTEIVYASLSAGSWDIRVINVDTKKVRQITNDAAEDSWPRWSPNGKRIVFSSTRDDPAGDLYTVAAGGGAVTRVTNDPGADTQPAWSTDNDTIAFTTTRWHSTGDIALVSAKGGAVTMVTSGSEPVWSLQNIGRIDFVDRSTNAGGAVYEVTVSTKAKAAPTGPTAITPLGLGSDRHPTWVSDKIMVTVYDDDGASTYVGSGQYNGTRTADIWTAGLDGSGLDDFTRRERLAERAPAYSPDGRFIAYQREVPYPENKDPDGRIPHSFVIAVSDLAGNIIWATRPGLRYADVDPAWSPKGDVIAFARKQNWSESGSESTNTLGEIRVVSAADGADRTTLECSASEMSYCNDGEPAWSPNGKQLAFTRATYSYPSYGFGGLLAFEDNVAWGSSIWVADYNTPPAFGAPNQITGGGESYPTDTGPVWTPDGKSVTFARNGAELLTAPSAMAPSGSFTTTSILSETSLTGIASPAYSLDGGTLVFSASAENVGGGESYNTATTAGFTSSDIYGITRDTETGGWNPPYVVIHEPGEDSQPAFQPSADVSVALQAIPTSIPLNGSGTSIRMTVTDHGWLSAPDTRATVVIPAGLKPTAIRTSKGSCNLIELKCLLGELNAGQSVTVTIDATGVMLGAAVVTGEATSARFDPDTSDNTGRTSVIVGEQADVAVAVAAVPATGYVGDAPITVTYTVTNRGGFAATGVKLAVALPTDLVTAVEVKPAGAGSCDTPLKTCVIGALAPTVVSGANAVTIVVTLSPKTAISTVLTGTVTADADSDPGNNTASVSIQVLAPTLLITPHTGEAGFVPRVIGRNFPPGALVTFAWDRGITQRTIPVTVAADGTFVVPVMVFNRDVLGLRTLRAVPAAATPTGTTFAPVTSGYLVVSGHDQPQDWLYRR